VPAADAVTFITQKDESLEKVIAESCQFESDV
jgi:hypothetical protein